MKSKINVFFLKVRVQTHLSTNFFLSERKYSLVTKEERKKNGDVLLRLTKHETGREKSHLFFYNKERSLVGFFRSVVSHVVNQEPNVENVYLQYVFFNITSI